MATSKYRASLALRCLSRLLDYPTEDLQANIGELARTLAQAPVPSTRRSGVARLLDRLACFDLYDAQELYIETFDRGRRTSLNLFEHVHGNSRDRGQAMVDLLQMYRGAGVELDSEQLPDYLPAFLEYLSVLPAAEARGHLAEVAHLVRAIGGALIRRGSDYAGALDMLLGLAGEAPLGADESAEDDTSYAAIDAAWVDAPVDFMGATSPCSGAAKPVTAQPIQFQRRVA